MIFLLGPRLIYHCPLNLHLDYCRIIVIVSLGTVLRSGWLYGVTFKLRDYVKILSKRDASFNYAIN